MAASNQESTIPLRYWVDNEQKRVVMAEASGEFVDILFSFLTLPLGTIIRRQLESQNQSHQAAVFGCIKKLYQTVKALDTKVFRNNICKEMLVSPRNPLEESCQRLKVKVDDTLPTKYFMCHGCSKERDLLLSTFEGARCYCGKLMRKKMALLLGESKEDTDSGVFVKGDVMFLIFDDLTVFRSSPSESAQQLLKLRHRDFSKLTEKSLNVGMDEIFSILKHALTSQTPLSDVLLENRESKPWYSFSPDIGPSHYLKGSVKIKVLVRKSQKKILFAETDGDFVDFLVSFLTTPLGSILKLMNGKLCLGSIGNLYKSVKDLNPSWFIGSSNESLLNLRVAPHFGCKRSPLQEGDIPKYWHGTVISKDNNEGRIMISKKKEVLRDPAELKLFDPRSSDGATKPAAIGSDDLQKQERMQVQTNDNNPDKKCEFVKRPCLFVVRDNLEVIPMTSSSISYLQEVENVQLDDVEELPVEIRRHSTC